MSRYHNEDGEPLMTHSQAMLESSLDEQSSMDSYYDDRDDGSSFDEFVEHCEDCDKVNWPKPEVWTNNRREIPEMCSCTKGNQ